MSRSPSQSDTPTATQTCSPSISVTVSSSPSNTRSPSVTISPTPSPIPLTELISQIDAIPLTNFSNSLIDSILYSFQQPVTTDTEQRVQPPYDRIAAGFFATNPDADQVVIKNGDITLTLAKLDPTTETTLGSSDAPIVIPPLPIPANAIVYVSDSPINAADASKFNLTSNSQSIGVVNGAGQEYSIQNLYTPIQIAFNVAPTNDTECSYWNTTLNTWASDGCNLIVLDGKPTCECNHLTEFALRFRAIADIQAGIINSLSKLLTLEGLVAAAPIIGLLGGIGLLLATLIVIMTILDNRASKKFAKLLDSSPILDEIRDNIKYPADKSWDSFQAGKQDTIVPEQCTSITIPKSLKQLVGIWLKRIPYFHPWLSIFFRFDPGLPRLFRTIFIVASFVTTIGISILFYGYRNPDPNAPPPEIVETIVLSLMTTSVSIPLTKILMLLMNKAGRYEFNGRYGHLATELIKQSTYLGLIKRLSIDDLDTTIAEYEAKYNKTLEIYADEWTTANAAASTSAAIDENFEETAGITLIFEAVASCFTRNKATLQAYFKHRFHNFITSYGKKTLIVSPLSRTFLRNWRLPFHTHTSAVCITLLIAWIGWLYTYILGFTAFKSADTTLTIIKTVSISLATSHLITQPLIQLVTLLIEYWKQGKQAPDEYLFNELHQLNFKVYNEFIGLCSLGSHDCKAALVCSPAVLLHKVAQHPTPHAKGLAERVKYIYDMINLR